MKFIPIILLLFFSTLNFNCLQPTQVEGTVDTLYISNTDTIVKKDSIFIQSDTVFSFDTVLKIDTVIIKYTTSNKDTVVHKDTVFSKDTIIRKDSLFIKDTVYSITRDTVFSITRDTTYIEDGNRIHVFFGPFSTTVDSVSRDGNTWKIQLPIGIENNWSGLTFNCPFSNWSSSTLVQDIFLETFVMYGFSGIVSIYDPDLRFQDEYWKIVLIEPL